MLDFEDFCMGEKEEEEEEEEETEEEQDVSPQFFYKHKRLIDSQNYLERYCNVLPIFGLNSSKYDVNVIKSYLLLLFVNEGKIDPKVIRKANRFVCFKFGDVQLPDTLKFLGGAMSLDFFFERIKDIKDERFYEWFDDPEKLNINRLPPYGNLFSKLRTKQSP